MQNQKNLNLGQQREERLVELVKEKYQKPSWFKDIHRGTKHQDGLGIDLVVKTDVGDLFVQVKSDRRDMGKFKKRQKTRDQSFPSVACIVYKHCLEAQLSGQLIGKLRKMRNDILAKKQLERYY